MPRRAPWIVLAALLLVGGGAGAWWWLRPSAPPPPGVPEHPEEDTGLSRTAVEERMRTIGYVQ